MRPRAVLQQAPDLWVVRRELTGDAGEAARPGPQGVAGAHLPLQRLRVLDEHAGLRATLAPLRAINSAKAAAASKTREDRIGSHGRAADGVPDEVAHPVGRVHPETGRRALYVNPGHTVRFEGWTEAESRPLLEYLFRQQIREEIVCRFRWQPGSIALWDNRCAQHYPVNDYHGHRRLLHRITLAGDVPA